MLVTMAASAPTEYRRLRPTLSDDDLPLRQRRATMHNIAPPKSCWEFDAISPMTSRPHFMARTRSPTGQPLRRIRSRSLGSNIPALPDLSLLLPPLKTIRSDQSLAEYPKVSGEEHSQTTPHDNDDLLPAAIDQIHDKPDNHEESLYISILYGIINASIVLPVLMSFASIIYRNPAFAPYMPVLVKLTVISGIVHQLCFSSFSSLPFAVGQVQDAGLIFLSSMSTYMVDYCHTRGYDDETLLATVTVGLAVCTAVLGLGLMLIGKGQLAQYVQMLPTCVVGGYLAFIGWFCGVSGVRLMAGVSELTVPTVLEQWQFVLPGLIGGIFIYTAVRSLRHMAVLPTCIILLLVIFYVMLWTTGTTVKEATEYGWIRAMDPPPVWYRTWDYLKLNKVVWSVFPNLLLTEVSMIFVVALSSSLDVAAIELELKQPLDYNHELITVGLSNLVSGGTGGYTGSYIFSQTIFSLRAGVRSRAAGYVLAASQFLVLILPFPLLSYVPNFFFGSLLIMICVDLQYEWLWDVRTRVTPAEYLIDLATFGLIQWLGVEYGIIAGVVLFVMCRRLGAPVGENSYEAEDRQSSEEESGLLESRTGSQGPPTNGGSKSEYGSVA